MINEPTEEELKVCRIMGQRSPRAAWKRQNKKGRAQIRAIASLPRKHVATWGAEDEILAILGAEREQLTEASLRRLEELARRLVVKPPRRQARQLWNGVSP